MTFQQIGYATNLSFNIIKKYRKNGNDMHAIVFVKYTFFPDTRSEQMLPATLAYIMLI